MLQQPLKHLQVLLGLRVSIVIVRRAKACQAKLDFSALEGEGDKTLLEEEEDDVTLPKEATSTC